MLRLIALLSIIVSGPAHALSCIPATPSEAFGIIEAAPERYWVVVGEIIGKTPPPLRGSNSGVDKKRTYEAAFTGHNVNRHGLANPTTMSITVTQRCIGPWCPSIAHDQKVLTFLRLDPSGTPALELDACTWNVFYNPTAQDMNEIKSCFVNGCIQ